MTPLNLPEGDDLVQTSDKVQSENATDQSPLNLPQDNLDQTTHPANIFNQPSSGNCVNETTPNIPEDQSTQRENVFNQLPLNLQGQTSSNLQPENQPSSRNYDGKLIIYLSNMYQFHNFQMNMYILLLIFQYMLLQIQMVNG